MAEARNPNMFAHNPLDRASEKRGNSAWIAEQLAAPSTRILPLWNLRPFLLAPPDERAPFDIGWLRPGLIDDLAGPDATKVFLGLRDGAAHFAVDLAAASDPDQSGPLAGLGVFKDLREAAMRLGQEDAGILAQAKSLVDWHARHRFCAQCGTPTEVVDGGYRRDCPNCKAQHFPRTDPVVIMLPVMGERCLLGRGPNFPRGMFSALAGFLEPGETIAMAVAREVYEETGIAVSDVRFCFDQPWPYPSSLMIGCLCTADSEEITIDGEEIAEARWFTREEIQSVLSGRRGPFWVPPPMAIAHQLLKVWAEDA